MNTVRMGTIRMRLVTKGEIAGSMILVTGADGFVGSEFTPALLRRSGSVIKARLAGGGDTSSGKGPTRSWQGTGDQAILRLHTIGVGDIGPDTDWTVALAGVDAVVHLLPAFT